MKRAKDLTFLPQVLDYKAAVAEVKNFLATALEEQRKAVIEEVLDWMDEMPLYIDGVDMSPFRAELRAKLAQMKGGEL
jgi:hypothetical protein